MRLAVLRVAGTQFDPDGFVKKFGLNPDIVWHAGLPDRFGRVRAWFRALTATVTFTRLELALLSECGVNLCFTAYPGADAMGKEDAL